MTRWRLLPLIALLASLAPCAAQGPSEPWDDPWVADPVLRGLADWISFRLTFDHESLLPEMAAGSWEGQVSGALGFAPGVSGLALRVGDGGTRAVFPRGPNATFGTRGAVSLWICPVQWTRVNGGNTVFLVASNGAFYLQRQGPGHDAEGKLTRQEALHYLIRGELTGNQTLSSDTSKWPDGEWRFVVASWTWPIFSWSINGGEFSGIAVKANPDESYFGDLVVGSVGGEPTLIDELTIYRRPLTLEETRRLYETYRPDRTEEQP